MHKKLYAQKLLDPRWQQLRLKIFERDKWTCRICAKSNKTLHAHHVHYHPLADGPWDYDEQTIITLCSDCHADEHSRLNIAKANFLLLLAKKGYIKAWDFECLADEIEMAGQL
jgi:5-methylcytosine-specific restriction endonuclease McrA